MKKMAETDLTEIEVLGKARREEIRFSLDRPKDEADTLYRKFD